MNCARLSVLAAVLAASTACRDWRGGDGTVDAGVVSEREAHLVQVLAKPADSAGTEPLARWILPESLEEISGLALSADGRLFAHGDEVGDVFELNYRSGVLVKQFSLGRTPVLEDFEGITIAGDRMYLLVSNGKIYEFKEGNNGARVDYVIHDTRLGHECEFEGITFDPGLNALLLACKNVRAREYRDDLVIYAWKLPDGGGTGSPQIVVPLKEIMAASKLKSFHASDMTRDPLSGNYVLTAAQENGLLTITPEGKVVSARQLPGSMQHTEGVAITPDSLLILSDEAGKHPAVIVLYRWR